MTVGTAEFAVLTIVPILLILLACGCVIFCIYFVLKRRRENKILMQQMKIANDPASYNHNHHLNEGDGTNLHRNDFDLN